MSTTAIVLTILGVGALALILVVALSRRQQQESPLSQWLNFGLKVAAL